jgi:outer membrane protein TolC
MKAPTEVEPLEALLRKRAVIARARAKLEEAEARYDAAREEFLAVTDDGPLRD